MTRKFTVQKWCHRVVSLHIAVSAAGCGLAEYFGGSGGGTDTDGPGGSETGDDFEHRYLLSQSVEFDGAIPGFPYAPLCESNNDIIDDISSLREALEDDNWNGRTLWDRFAFPGTSSWSHPESFAEEHSNPMFSNVTHPGAKADSTLADEYDLAIFTGHGSPGLLHSNAEYSPTPVTYSPCELDISHQLRLGRFCGKKNKVAVFGASCVAAIDQSLCPLLPDEDNDGIGDEHWPDPCHYPFECTLRLSASNHILTFMDSPEISADLTRNWYVFAKSVQSVAFAWLIQMNYDAVLDVKNQPFAMVQGTTLQDAVARANTGSIITGQKLDALAPDIVPKVLYYMVMHTGQTIFEDENGAPIQAWPSPDVQDACRLDHSEPCGNIGSLNPLGVSPNDCD